MSNKILKRKLRKSSKLNIWQYITQQYMQKRMIMHMFRARKHANSALPIETVEQ